MNATTRADLGHVTQLLRGLHGSHDRAWITGLEGRGAEVSASRRLPVAWAFLVLGAGPSGFLLGCCRFPGGAACGEVWRPLRYSVDDGASSTEQIRCFHTPNEARPPRPGTALCGCGFRGRAVPAPQLSVSWVSLRQVYASASIVRRVSQYCFSWFNLLSIIFMAALNFKRELREIENLRHVPVPKESR